MTWGTGQRRRLRSPALVAAILAILLGALVPYAARAAAPLLQQHEPAAASHHGPRQTDPAEPPAHHQFGAVCDACLLPSFNGLPPAPPPPAQVLLRLTFRTAWPPPRMAGPPPLRPAPRPPSTAPPFA